MKKLIIATLIFAGASTVSFAQSKTSMSSQTNSQSITSGTSMAEKKAQAETDRLVKALKLSTDQKVKIQEVNLHVETQMGHIRDAGAAASPERSKTILGHKERKYKEILTADQYAKYQQLGEQTGLQSKPMNSSN